MLGERAGAGVWLGFLLGHLGCWAYAFVFASTLLCAAVLENFFWTFAFSTYSD